VKWEFVFSEFARGELGDADVVFYVSAMMAPDCPE
jgi:hypothetical protein